MIRRRSAPVASSELFWEAPAHDNFLKLVSFSDGLPQIMKGVMSSTAALKLVPALIRGHGEHRICMVLAIKNPAPFDSLQLFGAPIRVLDGDDSFQDGSYELVVGAQTFTLVKSRGEYQSIT
jgi:hypothetical protein